MLINFILPLASILITYGALDQSELVQMKVTFKAKQKVHPLYRLGDGRNSVRFRGIVAGAVLLMSCASSPGKREHSSVLGT